MDFCVVPNPLPWAPGVREERGADRDPARQRCVGSLREDEDFTSRDDLSLGGRGGEVDQQKRWFRNGSFFFSSVIGSSRF